MSDTSREMQRQYDRMIRELSPQERFRRGLALTRLSREMCLAGLAATNPHLTAEELQSHLRDRLYGT